MKQHLKSLPKLLNTLSILSALMAAGCVPLEHPLDYLANDPPLPLTKQTRGLEQRKVMDYYTAQTKIFRNNATVCRVVIMGLASPVVVKARIVEKTRPEPLNDKNIRHDLILIILNTEMQGVTPDGIALDTGSVVVDRPEHWRYCY